MIPKYFINLHELEDKLKSFSYRVRKEDCLDLPEKIYQQRFVEFTIEQKRVYKQMQEQAFAIIQDQEVSFANKLTEMLKLHQVCNGFLKTNEGAIVELEDCPKLKELIKVIEEGDVGRNGYVGAVGGDVGAGCDNDVGNNGLQVGCRPSEIERRHYQS